MGAKGGYAISRHAESPMAVPVIEGYTGFSAEQGRLFARGLSLTANPVTVGTFNYEVGQDFLVDISEDIMLIWGAGSSPDKDVLQRLGREASASSQMSRAVSLAEYIRKAMRHATYETLSDGTFYGEIPGLQGVWANEPTLEACVDELRSALEDWVRLCIGDGLSVPEIDGVRFFG